MNTPYDESSLMRALMTMARCAGVTLDEDTATLLTPILALVVRDWKTLTAGAAPDVEPMSIGRWPEVSDDME